MLYESTAMIREPCASFSCTTEDELAAVAVALLGSKASASDRRLAGRATASETAVATARKMIRSGEDPLGEALCRLRSPEARRPMGATYTPERIIASMLAWLKSNKIAPARFVDIGCGSGRFLAKAATAFPNTRASIGVEIDHLPAMLARANLLVLGLTERAQITEIDYRKLILPPCNGTTVFIGNPPYVRHHLIESHWKEWLTNTANGISLEASQLAGLHVHFFLATAKIAKPGDVGVLITASEWLDVNYGRLVRDLMLSRLGLSNLQVIEPTALPFADAATTAVITCFEVGTKPKSIGVRRVETVANLGVLESTHQVRRERFEASTRWSPLTRLSVKPPDGYVELGELCRVHRGQVTGANHIWIEGDHSDGLPDSVLFSSVTRAKELFAAGNALTDPKPLKRVIDIPVDLDAFSRREKTAIERFMDRAKAMGAKNSFIASHRKAWWAVGLRRPAPILATYMARRSPAFVRNLAEARHINVAHGLYPREVLSESALGRLATYLTNTTSTDQGRTYAGGLTKFEPREMERLFVPSPALLDSNESLH